MESRKLKVKGVVYDEWAYVQVDIKRKYDIDKWGYFEYLCKWQLIL